MNSSKPARHESGLISPESSEKGRALLAFHERVKSCTQCPLAKSRKHFVFGMGNPEAELVMAGEAPGEQEDLQGLPFVGRAGLLLDRVLGKLGMSRDDAFIANVLKCRPPGNRQPGDEEIAACEPYLAEQIRIISPKVIVALGAYAAQTLLKTRKPIGQLRGRTYPVGSALLIATYHPAAILRNPSNEPILEGDLKRARELLTKPRGNPS